MKPEDKRLCWASLAVAAGAVGCTPAPGVVLDDLPEVVGRRLAAADRLVDATLGGERVRYLGFSTQPQPAQPGLQVTLSHYWVANRPIPASYRVFVHFLLQGAKGWIPHDDHDPGLATERWPVGKVVEDRHSVRLGPNLPADRIAVLVGLYRGDRRMPVDHPRWHDGSSRIRAGSFAVAGTALPLPQYQAPRLAKAPRIDGDISEQEWRGAPWTQPFVASHGRGPAALRTRARLAWDREHLYVGMAAEDPDIQATHRKRDDPIYRLEALEMFVDPEGKGRSYVELQVSPLGTQFDAAFSGGPRRNMDVGYSASFEAAVLRNGTVQDPSDRDVGWSTEWRVDAATIPGAQVPLRAGECWRLNLYRVAKDREALAGGRRKQRSEESAWSPPLMGDFHNLERLGRVCFR